MFISIPPRTFRANVPVQRQRAPDNRHTFSRSRCRDFNFFFLFFFPKHYKRFVIRTEIIINKEVISFYRPLCSVIKEITFLSSSILRTRSASSGKRSRDDDWNNSNNNNNNYNNRDREKTLRENEIKYYL